MGINNRRGVLTMEMITAMAVLTLAFLPLLSLHAAVARHGMSVYHEAVLNEMLTDRLAVLRAGGWMEHGLCERKEIDFIGKAAKSLPDGSLLLSIKRAEEEPSLLEIILSWEPDRRRGRAVSRETLVFTPGGDDYER